MTAAMPDAKTMQEIVSAVLRKTGSTPTREELATALDAVMRERLQDALTLADLINANMDTYVDTLVA